MKILIYSHYFLPSVGGVETIANSLAAGVSGTASTLDEKPVSVTVATQTPAGDFDDRALPFRVVRQPSLRMLWKLISDTDVLHTAGPAFLPLLFARIKRKPTVVEHHGYQAVCMNGLLMRHPEWTVCHRPFESGQYQVCVRCQNHETPLWKSLASLFFLFLRNHLCHKASANVAVSQHVQNRLKLPNSLVIYHGIDDLKQAGPRESTSSSTTFAYVGRLVSEKGLGTLLEAAELLKTRNLQFKLLLIGDGPERRNLEGTIQQRGLAGCVEITGFLNGHALSEKLSSVSAVIMPSLWEETAGLSAIEQMMRGRLVIASRIGGLHEVVGESALSFTPGSAPELAECMQKTLQDPSLAAKLGGAARERALHLFRRDAMIKKHLQLYERILSNAAAAKA